MIKTPAGLSVSFSQVKEQKELNKCQPTFQISINKNLENNISGFILLWNYVVKHSRNIDTFAKHHKLVSDCFSFSGKLPAVMCHLKHTTLITIILLQLCITRVGWCHLVFVFPLVKCRTTVFQKKIKSLKIRGQLHTDCDYNINVLPLDVQAVSKYEKKRLKSSLWVKLQRKNANLWIVMGTGTFLLNNSINLC